MRHFLFEFITGGGLADQALTESLVKEGDIMLQTLLTELSDIEGSEISFTRDSRLSLIKIDAEQFLVENKTEEKLSKLLKKSDVSWLIAPETNDCLARYAELFIKHGKRFIGSSPAAIRITASKWLTNKKLSEAGIKVVETRWLSEAVPESKTGWIIKPDDGVGGEDACLVQDEKKIIETVEANEVKSRVVQPYMDGKHMSMSLLVFEGNIQLLACNKQYIDIKNGLIKLTAIGVNESLSFKDDMLQLAKKIVTAIPGLAGYIGVDLIESEKKLYVVEINPRFTTAYAGIPESISCNVAAKILNTFINNKLPDIDLASAKPVIINI